VEIQAQSDEMLLDACKDLRISSSDGKILISAKNEIILTSGGGYIRIEVARWNVPHQIKL
jgi:type VI secretion system secreted protein VgrG